MVDKLVLFICRLSSNSGSLSLLELFRACTGLSLNSFIFYFSVVYFQYSLYFNYFSYAAFPLALSHLLSTYFSVHLSAPSTSVI